MTGYNKTKTDFTANLVLVVLTIAFSIAALFFYSFNDGRLFTIVAAFSLVIPGYLGIIAARRGGMLDPVAVFAVSYAAYNGLILTRFVFMEPSDFPYPFAVDRNVILRAAILSSVGALGIVVGWLAPNMRYTGKLAKRSTDECAAAFSTGVVFFLAGLFFYALQYQQLGGYFNAMTLDRVERFDMMKQTVSTPYVAFVIVGLVFMFYGSLHKSRAKTQWSIAALVLWVLAVGLQGDRRLILQVLMGVGLIAGLIRPSITKLRVWALAVGLAGLFLALLFGQYRPMMTLLISRGMTFSAVVDLATQEASSSWMQPENTEFGLPYVSMLDVSRRKQDLLLGSTYLMSLPAFLPRALYPGKKATAPSQLLAESLNFGLRAPMGWGYTPVAEAYSNFGFPGPLLILGCWSMFFAWLARIQYSGMSGAVLTAILVQEAVNVNRIDFRSVYLEAVFCVAAVAAALPCVSILRNIKHSERSRDETAGAEGV